MSDVCFKHKVNEKSMPILSKTQKANKTFNVFFTYPNPRNKQNINVYIKTVFGTLLWWDFRSW